HNLGMMANWNQGISYCRGQYWGKLDADDYWSPDMVGDCVNILNQYPEVGLVCTNYRVIDAQGKFMPEREYRLPLAARHQPLDFTRFVKKGPDQMLGEGIAHQGIGLLRAKIFDQLGRFSQLAAGDIEMWYRIGAHYKIFALDKFHHFYRSWAGNFTHTQVLAQDKAKPNYYEMRQAILDYYVQQGQLSQKEYHRFSQENQFARHHHFLYHHRAKGAYLKSFYYLGQMLLKQPEKTWQFYKDRLLSYLK
ncbi:MAG: glycosyltransferase, partial [Bacteroidota bacterium]